MPTLDWIGKQAVRNHHREVPYRLLKCDKALSVGDPGSGNLVVQGDNLVALKALLPYYAGQVKCIYIDPPYNTGNEGWVYNDATNSPEIRQWLGRVVGAEAEDLSRHDKWLCMMYPRLQLLRQFLSDDGAIFISIDDNEVASLRFLMDEVFGPQNFVATVIWQKVYSPKNSARHFSEDHDYILVYAKNASTWRPNLVPRSSKQDRAYKNPDNDERGVWKTSDLSARNFYSLGTYSIACPSGRIIEKPPTGRYWVVSEEKFAQLQADRRIWWGKNGSSIPQLKRFLSEVKQGVVPQTLWTYDEVGHTQDAKKELVSLLNFDDSASVFITPKPTRLLKRIIELTCDKNSLVLDSFAGSGTTGQAVLDLNRQDGGSRRFILIEMEEAVCRDVTAQRLTRVLQDDAARQPGGGAGTGETTASPSERGFRFCTLGEPLFDETGNIRSHVTFSDLAAHVFFTETGEPIPQRATGKTPLIGICQGIAYYLLFNGVLGDRRPDGGNVLTSAVLDSLPPHAGPRIVYGEGCRLGSPRLQRAGIVFKQVPYEIKVS